jgi:hypothetical protein
VDGVAVGHMDFGGGLEYLIDFKAGLMSSTGKKSYLNLVENYEHPVSSVRGTYFASIDYDTDNLNVFKRGVLVETVNYVDYGMTVFTGPPYPTFSSDGRELIVLGVDSAGVYWLLYFVGGG